MNKKEREIDKINRLERTRYPLDPRNEIEEKYFQITQKKNRESVSKKIDE